MVLQSSCSAISSLVRLFAGWKACRQCDLFALDGSSEMKGINQCNNSILIGVEWPYFISLTIFNFVSTLAAILDCSVIFAYLGDGAFH